MLNTACGDLQVLSCLKETIETTEMTIMEKQEDSSEEKRAASVSQN